MTNKKTPFKTASRSRTGATLRGTGRKNSSVPLARSSNVPAAKYDSTIVSAKPTITAAGADAAEIIYELRAADGTVYKVREVIPFDLWVFDKFCDAMIKAGLQDGDDLSKAIGIKERVILEYPTPGGIGRFKERHPISSEVDTTGTDESRNQQKLRDLIADIDEDDDDYDDDDYD